ncbi:efflux RND transporter periplasmic adaptor subunit [Photobacterium sp. WH77]|uniref:efflux RND transporter periplasmic adaptor subunit n=1 Tax=Photobacterium TaxID=657 RepID=UPI001EDA8FC7|nr:MULTISPECIES: efflux RND transporter periplasmic adaptor subunit [Photobacterium]MCG2835686.1 efflux RND transporter periplasmic adaptor subunit [Photobacterium sp. WH77]MCG2843299.1 efflux RND transporter periplasmic adaptor subunit [Photobacterium sp. WH80]MDO6579714.1 efflux RND transporter periplasmic adaptor subunit [Photobacterium sp. 2_MG-2023]
MKKVVLAVVVAASLAGGGYFYFQQQSHAAQAASQPKPGRSVPVATGEVTSHEVVSSVSLVGKLAAQRSVTIATEVAAKVDRIVVDTERKVTQGQLLVQLDNAKPKAAYDEAKAYYDDEKRKYTEYQRLVKRGALTQTELIAQQASVSIAKARLDAAKAELDDHQIRAPFTGTVGLIDFSAGHTVTVGSELFTLDDLSQMRLDVQVPEQYLSKLAPGMAVLAKSQAWPDDTFHGTIQAIDSRVQAESLNIRVRVSFDNASGKLKPGMLMAAALDFTPQQAAIIPVQALEYSGTKRFVYLVDAKGIAHRTEVTLGARVKNEVVIESGIQIGDRIVVQGLVNMRDGLAVQDVSLGNPSETKAASVVQAGDNA